MKTVSMCQFVADDLTTKPTIGTREIPSLPASHGPSVLRNPQLCIKHRKCSRAIFLKTGTVQNLPIFLDVGALRMGTLP